MGWVQGKKGWLKGYVRPNERAKKPEDSLDDAKSPKDEAISEIYGVMIKLAQCPKCGSKNQKCYHSKPPVRYHKCLDCDFNFKSTEMN